MEKRSSLRNYTAKNVDEYINHAPKEAADKMSELRKEIKLLLPNAEEKIAWGVPFFKENKYIIGYTYFKTYISFGLTGYLSTKLTDELHKKGYKTGLKTVQVKFNQEIPTKELEELIKLYKH